MSELYTPVIKVKFSNVIKPSFKFDPKGVYDLVGIVEDEEFIQQMRQLSQDGYTQALKQVAENKRSQIRSRELIFPDKNKQGEETGDLAIKFKSNYTRKDAQGNEIKTTIPLFDKDKQKLALPEDYRLSSGTLVVVKFLPLVFYSPASKQAGYTLILKAVQIIDDLSSNDRF